jgi:hypothetical protein
MGRETGERSSQRSVPGIELRTYLRLLANNKSISADCLRVLIAPRAHKHYGAQRLLLNWGHAAV